jgi:LytS/YehU family sensor histidine kinase
VLEARVPSLLLQPLVENAVRHGIAPLQRGGRITVSAAREAGRLLLTIEDDGAGALSDAAPREGVGLRNTRARLARLYPETHDLTIDRPSAGGFRVRVQIPYSTAAGANGSNGGGPRP